MNMQMFAILDAVAQHHTQPFCSTNSATASREFANTINEKGTKFFTNPEDYSLYHIGQYDQDTGVLIPHDRVLVLSGHQAKETDAQ